MIMNLLKKRETPIYHGGLSKEIIFNEVIATAPTESSVLGQLAGKGGLASKHKGGSLSIRIDEPGFFNRNCISNTAN